MQKFKAEIEAQFACHLEEHSFWKQLASESPAGFRAVRETLLAPGKRLRPLLFCAACRDAGREPVPDLMPVALALELAHAFILIHDDIIDRSDERRGAPTLSKRMDELFAKNPADGFRGADFALVTGDLLYTLAIESLLQAKATDAQKTEAVRLFTRAALDTGRGALLEMRAAQTPLDELTVGDIEKIYALKTGSYTFALPLQLAVVFSSSNGWKKDDPVFPDIGKHAGIAFQLLNDQNSIADDLRDDRRTWAIVYAGSKEAINDSVTLTAVRKAQEEHARHALTLADKPELNALLRQMLCATA
jgi:geranylgeranyl diphosphate synthase type I